MNMEECQFKLACHKRVDACNGCFYCYSFDGCLSGHLQEVIQGAENALHFADQTYYALQDRSRENDEVLEYNLTGWGLDARFASSHHPR